MDNSEPEKGDVLLKFSPQTTSHGTNHIHTSRGCINVYFIERLKLRSPICGRLLSIRVDINRYQGILRRLSDRARIRHFCLKLRPRRGRHVRATESRNSESRQVDNDWGEVDRRPIDNKGRPRVINGPRRQPNCRSRFHVDECWASNEGCYSPRAVASSWRIISVPIAASWIVSIPIAASWIVSIPITASWIVSIPVSITRTIWSRLRYLTRRRWSSPCKRRRIRPGLRWQWSCHRKRWWIRPR